MGLGWVCWRDALRGESGESEGNFRACLAGDAVGLGFRGLGSVFVAFGFVGATKIPPDLYKFITLDGGKKRLCRKYKSFIIFYHTRRTHYGVAAIVYVIAKSEKTRRQKLS
jgi:hypothetical protein